MCTTPRIWYVGLDTTWRQLTISIMSLVFFFLQWWSRHDCSSYQYFKLDTQSRYSTWWWLETLVCWWSNCRVSILFLLIYIDAYMNISAHLMLSIDDITWHINSLMDNKVDPNVRLAVSLSTNELLYHIIGA